MSSVPCTVMISYHPEKMSKSATKLKRQLEDWGASVLNSTGDDSAGVSYSAGDLQAVEMIKTCSVFIALMNEDWAMSHECKDEINVAKRLQLTSHVRGRTAPGSVELPFIVPVAFSDLRVEAHSHLKTLLSKVGFIYHDQITLQDGRVDGTISDIIDCIQTAGIRSRHSAPVGEKRDRETLEAVAGEADGVEAGTGLQHSSHKQIRIPGTLPVGTKYFGTSSLSGIMDDGHTYENWQSCEITITGGDNNHLSCEIMRTELRKSVDGSSDPLRDPPLPSYLQRYLTALGAANCRGTGTYNSASGLLQLSGTDIDVIVASDVVWTKGDYYLTAHDDYLTGIFLVKSDLTDRENKPGTLLLRKL